MKLVKRNISGFAVIVAAVIAFTFLFVLFSPKEPLKPYSDTTNGASSETSKDTYYTEYIGQDPFFSVNVPADWVRVTQDGYPTWICKAYNSSLQIQTFPSSSSLLNITGDTVRAEIEALDGELVDFYWMDEWDYTVSYRLYQKSGTTAHIEVTAFNTKDAVRFVFVITEIHYDKVSGIVAEVLDSFVWDRFNDELQPDGSTP